MRMGIRKEIDWDYVGALLAQQDDGAQAQFFKAFVKECQSWGTNTQVEYQLASINQKLSLEEKNLLGMIGHVEE